MAKEVCKHIFFFFFWLLVCGLLVGAFLGQPNQTSRAFDPDGMPCGGDGLAQYPYAYFTNPDSRYLYKTLCISQCPYTDSNGKLTPIQCAPNSITKSCEQHITPADLSQTTLLYDSFLYKGIMCLPRTLQYYDEVKAGSIPSNSFKIISDLYSARFAIFSVSVIAILFSYIMMFLLKKETKTLVWLFTIGVFFFVGGLSMYFAREFRTSFDYKKLSDNMSTFKVTEQYIDQMTYEPQVVLNGILAGVFVIATLYGVYFLYNQHGRIADLTDIFEIVEDFMKVEKYLQEFITYAIGGFIAIINLMFYALLYLAACYTNNEGVYLLPFEHVKHDIPFYVHFIFYPICFWIITTYIGFITHFIALSLKREVYKENNGVVQNFEFQQDQNVKIQNGEDFYTCFGRINTLCYFSFVLIFQPFKLIADFFRDWVQGIQTKWIKMILENTFCCICYKYYKFVRDDEEIMYLELVYAMTEDQRQQQNIQDDVIKLVKENVKTYLELNERNEKVIEAFEKIRNLGDFFILIAKLLVALFSAGTCGLICKLFEMPLFSINIPCSVSALFGFFIASIYFSIYSISVPGLGYIYLRERKINKDRGGQNQNNSNFVLIKTKYPILAEMMERNFPNEV